MLALIPLVCFALVVASQFRLIRSSKLAQVRKFQAFGVSDDRARQFYRDAALPAFKERWLAMVVNGSLLSAFTLSVVWFAMH
jgi:hypothetical protein